MPTPNVSDAEYLVLTTCQSIIRSNLGAVLTEIETEQPSLGFTLDRPKSESVEVGDIRGVWPLSYPCFRFLVSSTEYDESISMGKTDAHMRLLLRIYVQNVERSSAEHNSLSVLHKKAVLYNQAARRVIERDLLPGNGATGVWKVRTQTNRYLEPVDLEKRRGIVHISETIFIVSQRVLLSC